MAQRENMMLRVSAGITLYLFWQVIFSSSFDALFFSLLFVATLSLILYLRWRVPRIPVQSPAAVGLSKGASFARTERTSVLVCSWNVGDAPPPSVQQLQEFMRSACSKHGQEQPELIAVGAQECAFKPRREAPSCEADWTATLHETVGSGSYYLVGQVSIRDSIRLCVFALNSLRPHITNVQTTAEVLTAPVVYRKGGEAIVFYLHGTSYCFVNCHLTAHAGKYKARNRDCATLVGSLRAGNPEFSVTTQFDHCFWFGDMNYRFGKELSRDAVIAAAGQHDWDRLAAADELTVQHRQQAVLSDFRLSRPAFAPTYQYALDRLPREYARNKKMRTPAWCDRVLDRSVPQSCTLLGFSCAENIATSDHSPVYALFNANTLIYEPLPLHASASAPSSPLCCYTLALRGLSLSGYQPARSYCQVIVGGSPFSLQQTDPYEPHAVARSAKLLVNDGRAPAWGTGALCPPPLLTFPCTEKCLGPINLLVAVRDFGSSAFLDQSLVGEGWLPLRNLGSALTAKPLPFSIPLTAFGASSNVSLVGELVIRPYPHTDLQALRTMYK